jgi:hypothetical protein
MASKLRSLFIGIAIVMVTACSQEPPDNGQDQNDVTESGIFDDFRYPERYAAIVEAAESGDEKSIGMLAQYYANFPKTDLRNLEYWSLKASQIRGRGELTNLIVALASHGECGRAWKIVHDTYANPSEFEFYKAEGAEEVIDGTCKRELKAG